MPATVWVGYISTTADLKNKQDIENQIIERSKPLG